jgi:hypothetical protein
LDILKKRSVPPTGNITTVPQVPCPQPGHYTIPAPTEGLMNNELERMWKEAVMPGMTDEGHKDSQSE